MSLATISGNTRVATVIGSPVRHSLSPAIHNAAFGAIGFDAVYLATDVAEGDAAHAVDAMRRFDWLGMSVTMPHKAAVLDRCDQLSDAAASLEAANCLYWHDDAIVGDNTDGEGFLRGLAAELAVDPAGQRCVLVGAGGAARAVVRALAQAGANEIVVINRSPQRALDAIAQAPNVARLGTTDDLSDAAIAINATPIGMAGTSHAGAVPFDVERLDPDAVVCDLIYHPAETPLLAAARARGLLHQNGLSMLVFQAAVAFEHWTEQPAPVEAMQAAVEAALAG